MKNLDYDSDIVAFIKEHDKNKALMWIKIEVHVYHDVLTPDMKEALASIDDYLESKLSVHRLEKSRF